MIVAAMAGPATAAPPPFGSLAEAFAGPRSRYFGAHPDGSPKDPGTHYRSDTPGLVFEVSNGMILAAVDRHGRIVNAVTMENGDTWPGSSSWHFSVGTGTQDVRLDRTAGIGVDLLGGLFPVHVFSLGYLRIRQLVFAPVGEGPAPARPRAIIVIFQLDNPGREAVEATLRVREDVVEADRLGPDSPRAVLDADCYPRYPERKKQFKPGYQAVACLDDTAWNPGHPSIRTAVPAGGTRIIALGLIVDATAEGVVRTARQIRERTAVEWLNETWAVHALRVGSLTIPGDPYFAELHARLVEAACNSVLAAPDGRTANADGGDPLLPLVDPDLAVLMMGPRGTNSLRNFDSLYAMLWGVWQRAIYYQVTGDASFFRGVPAELEQARAAFADALAHKPWERPFLFPCRVIWDGLARGDWHTGSNIILWHCWTQWSRIARDAYGDREQAAAWEDDARRIREDIQAHCIGKGESGPQYFEGGYRDGTFSPCHDGEEVATSYAPFLGFCEVDDPAMLNYKRFALTPRNRLYAPAVDGVYWLDGEEPFSGWWGGVTFPGSWPAGLAAAASESEVRSRLNRVRRVTDLDGSFWWWPYCHGATDAADVRRRDGDADVGKTAYAASLWCVLFMTKVIGLSVDAPARAVRFAPFSPWDRFSWERCRLGQAWFDLSYTRTNGSIRGEIVNRNGEAWAGVLELVLPEGCTSAACRLNGDRTDGEIARRYGRTAYRSAGTIAPNGSLRFEVTWPPVSPRSGRPSSPRRRP